ncbi:MAG TPA: SDR family oxidoreductase [Solirubrobacteraceae bacterium]|nr:SDR family oxidoreductase [Solirubrobacteraceae bacterium]
MILVVGATGQLGGLIARMLLDRRQPVRILVRNGSSCDALAAAGAEAVTGDLKDPDSLAAACAGADAIVTTANSIGRGGEDTIESVDRVGNRNLVDASVAAGVNRYVLISSLGADAQSPSPFLRAKGETEERLRDSGMAWTVLQPNVFMDILIPALVGYPTLANQPVTLVGEARRRHSFVARRDVAAYAVAALGRQEAEGQTLPIAGPEPVTWRDIVATFERELGRDLPVHTIAPGESVPGLPEMASQLLATLETYDSPLDITEIADTYGVRPTTLADFVRDLIAADRVAARQNA